MEAKAIAKNVGVSQKKVMIPANIVRGMNALEAVQVLKYMKKAAALPVKKVVESAIANAVTNYGMSKETLVIKEIRIDKGIVFKRFKTAARGNYKPFIRPHCNILVTLKEFASVEEPKKEEVKEPKKSVKKKTVKVKKSAK